MKNNFRQKFHKNIKKLEVLEKNEWGIISESVKKSVVDFII